MLIWPNNLFPLRFSSWLVLLSAIALVMVGAFVTLYENELYRSEKIQGATVQAQILAASVTAALVFDDAKTAQEYVDALQSNPELEAAGVYDAMGARIAGFARERSAPLPAAVEDRPPYIADGRIFVSSAVKQDSKTIGIVYLRSSVESFGRRLTRNAGIILLVTMAVLVLTVSAASQRALAKANAKLESQANDLAESNVRLQAEMQEREKAEEALRQSQKMEAIGQLSGGIAHDFNNLLTIIKGNLQLMQRRLAQGRTDVQRFLESASEGVNRAANLTQRILAFSRRQPLSPKLINLSQLVENMRDLLRHSVGDKVEIDMRLDADWTALCDANQMENVILNLAINASDAMPAGGRLTISTSNRPRVRSQDAGPADYVELSVRDTGTGMTEETRQKAVEPFFTTKPQGRGTGLGLSMTFGYVRQSNGYLEIASELGKGTVITILMPRHQHESVEMSA